MRHVLKLSVPALAASLLLVACGSSSSSTQPATHSGSSSSSAIVKTTTNSTLGTILVNSQGMTLYHLSGEQNGKFICTSSACLGVWHPLIAPSSGTPSGELALGTVKRPEGTMQVTYKGAPLYMFASDKQAGETNGQGIKDVGTWSAATTGSSSTSAASPTSSSESEKSSGNSSGGGYGY